MAMMFSDSEEKFNERYDEVVDENGNHVSPLDDDYYSYKHERYRRNDPLDDDYIREGYR